MLNRFSGIENIMRIGDKMVRTAGSITGVDTGKTLRFSHDTSGITICEAQGKVYHQPPSTIHK